MTYSNALNYIEILENQKLTPSLDNSLHLMHALGNPQNTMPVIHVAGTNGKGSTIAFMKSILEAGGYHVGVCQSPYILTPREMTVVGSEMISEEAFAQTMATIEAASTQVVEDGHPQPTAFECLTALSLTYLASCHLDCVLVETGMGGRFDATNVFDHPLLTVITSIDYDHQQFLGQSLEEIAWHKGGIIKPDVPTVIGPNPIEVINTISDCVRITGHKLYLLDWGLVNVTKLMASPKYQLFHLSTAYYDYKALQTSMIGDHQIKNLALALLALTKLKKHYPLDVFAIKSGVKKAHWTCRNDLIHTSPSIIVDGGHNLSAFNAIESLVKVYYPDHKVITVMGILSDKDQEGLLEVAGRFSDHIILTEPPCKRRLAIDDYRRLPAGCDCIADYKEALKKGLSLTGDKTLLLVIGSLYLAYPGKLWLLQQL